MGIFIIKFIPSILSLKEKAEEFCWVGNERYILIALKKPIRLLKDYINNPPTPPKPSFDGLKDFIISRLSDLNLEGTILILN